MPDADFLVFHQRYLLRQQTGYIKDMGIAVFDLLFLLVSFSIYEYTVICTVIQGGACETPVDSKIASCYGNLIIQGCSTSS